MKSKAVLLFLFLLAKLSAQEIASEEVQLHNGDILIPGTLSFPVSDQKVPLIIFVHGSGNPDRNGNQEQMQIKPAYIKQLAEALNSQGIAVFRFDSRPSVKENLPILLKGRGSFDDLVADVRLMTRHFKSDPRFSKIILVGHSQGSLTAMLAVDDQVDAYVSLAGSSENLSQLLLRQLELQNKDLANTAAAYFDELKTTDTIQNVHPFLMSIFNPVNHKFIKTHMAHEPTEAIKQVHIPMLIINGTEDAQIRVEDAETLHKANPDSELEIIPKMNHLLKEVNDKQENLSSYYSEKFPLSQRLVEVIVKFTKS